MRLSEILAHAEERLRDGGIERPDLEARWLIAAALDIPIERFFLDEKSTDRQAEVANRYIDRRVTGEPIQLILGEWDFYGRTFALERGVFVPRPETEGLVELALKNIGEQPAIGFEFGIGSGIVSVSLLRERPGLRMVATDVNPLALELSRKNASTQGVQDRLELFVASEFEAGGGRFDFVISNPPYVLSNEMTGLSREVRNDPPEALDGGADGLREIRKIIEISNLSLKSGGFVLLEIHEDKARETAALFSEGFSKTNIFRDLAGKDRYMFAIKE